MPEITPNFKIPANSVGEMPTSGGLRPGPLCLDPISRRTLGVKPFAIRIAKAGVEAEVETIEIVDGKMQDPTGPWIVSWYKETAKLGELGNAVMAGHLDYWGVGPAVFAEVGSLEPDDEIQVTGEDGFPYLYKVEWVRHFDADNAPIEEIVGSTDIESLTLITCGGEFDEVSRVYLQRTIVRSHRVWT